MAQVEELQQDPITQRLRALDPQSVAEVIEFRGERTLVVPRAHLLLGRAHIARRSRACDSIFFPILPPSIAILWSRALS